MLKTEKLYYAIVGSNANTNEGLGRFVPAFVVFIAIAGAVFWSL